MALPVTTHHETTLGSEPIYSGKIIKVRVDTVQFQNGKTGKTRGGRT